MRLYVCLFFLVGVCFLTFSGAAQTVCPECFYDQVPPVGHGQVDGRTALNVFAEGFPSGQDEIVATAITVAAQGWNSATDTGAPGGNQIPYHLQTTSEPDQADFIVRLGTPTGSACASIDITAQPPVITVSMTAVESGNLEAILKHEFGHRFGLANAVGSAACGTSTSIMRGHAPGGCTMVVQEIQPSDVAQVRRNFDPSTRPTCTEPGGAASPMQEETGPSCPDNDFDGVTTCDGDCDDFDPSYTYDCYYNYYQYPECYARYEVTDYYYCTSSDGGETWSCRYQYSTWEYMYTYCYY
ncbi:MAG TPA: hypothetical protein VD968_03280 [Pyrinomonadaceae bacterium]|nr:hypothetical protein [Pyrinomonadaceae bacterium]